MTKRAKQRPKRTRDLYSPRAGMAERLWVQFAEAFNRSAYGTGLAIVPLPASAGASLAQIGNPWLTPAEVNAMKMQFFADHIDSVWAFAEYGFDLSRPRKKRNEEQRSKLDRLLIWSLRRHTDYSNKEIWEVALKNGDYVGLRIDEVGEPADLCLEWEDTESGESDTLRFSSFQVRLSKLRAELGILRRARRKS